MLLLIPKCSFHFLHTHIGTFIQIPNVCTFVTYDRDVQPFTLTYSNRLWVEIEPTLQGNQEASKLQYQWVFECGPRKQKMWLYDTRGFLIRHDLWHQNLWRMHRNIHFGHTNMNWKVFKRSLTLWKKWLVFSLPVSLSKALTLKCKLNRGATLLIYPSLYFGSLWIAGGINEYSNMKRKSALEDSKYREYSIEMLWK